MKFARVDGNRQEAQPGLSGECPGCGQPMVAKCGEIRVPHWAHKGRRVCDPWWENETPWHRAWKDQFPVEWQEVVQHAKDGERHIADVKTDRDWVIEFQHSYLNPPEHRARDAFYPKLVWVVDGTRRGRDAKQFIEAFNNGVWVVAKPPIVIRQVPSDECALLLEWAGSHVFFDFGDAQGLWWLVDGRPDGTAYVVPVSRASFIEMHRGGVTTRDFNDVVKDFRGLIADYESYRQRQALQQSSVPLPGFQRYLNRRARHRPRF